MSHTIRLTVPNDYKLPSFYASADPKTVSLALTLGAEAYETMHEKTVLSVRSGDRDAVIREVRSWSAAAPAISGTIHCAPPLAQMAAAHASAALGVIVVKVEYIGGTDLCWEPPETWHVAKFPAGGIAR